MLIVTREKLVAHLLELSAIVDRYQRSDPEFVEQVAAWLIAVEKTLQQLRSPLSSQIAGQRARLLAVQDGFREPSLAENRVSRRKAVRAAAGLVVGRAEEALRARLAAIDARFDEAREKMAQYLAVTTSVRPIPLPPTEPRTAWLRSVWASLEDVPNTQGMRGYLNAALRPSDRLHVLGEVVDNLIENNGD